MKVMHLLTKSSMSMPVALSPRFNWVVRFMDKSAVDTRRRESKVASEVCLTVLYNSLERLRVLMRPSELGARNSARESVIPSQSDVKVRRARPFSRTGQFAR